MTTVFGIFAIGSLWGLTALLNNAERRAEQSAVSTAEVVATLTVHRNISESDFDGKSGLTAAETGDLNADFAALSAAHRVVGLLIWGVDGRLVYADPNRPLEDRTLSGDEQARLTQPSGWVVESSAGGPPVRDVFVPYDAGTDGVTDGLIELIIPGARIDKSISNTTRELYALAALSIVLGAGALFLLRRRLLTGIHRARHDRLTGALNWPTFQDEVQCTLDSQPDGATVLMIGLNRFRSVNETLGHEAGDRLLQLVAGNIKVRASDDGCVGRLSGDEFAVLLRRPGPDGGLATAERILHGLHFTRFEVCGVSIAVEAAIGITPVTAELEGAVEVLRRADVAMRYSKRNGTGMSVYDAGQEDRSVEELSLLGDLRTAIDSGQLVLHYQPQADLAGRRIEGVEALVRWRHPTRGILFPDAFIPLAERGGLLWPLTEWVLTQAISDAANWRRSGLSLTVAVNISPRSLFDERLPSVIADLLQRSGLPPALLEVEIVETAVMTDPKRSSDVLGRLRNTGIKIALDDFGTGYTSLSYLRALPLDMIKIDRSFIAELVNDAKAHAVAQSMIELAHRLGLRVLAEGIETEQAWTELVRLECDSGQGYHLARPMPGEQIEGWVTAHRHTIGDHDQNLFIDQRPAFKAESRRHSRD
ncbi:MAG: Diguanylate cyclase/phosphodiesterase [Acidimicrobiales bacterium]|nr:Diguanylate cyclase/phosphodiesterase [Acidimicrobiales bacterium]